MRQCWNDNNGYFDQCIWIHLFIIFLNEITFVFLNGFFSLFFHFVGHFIIYQIYILYLLYKYVSYIDNLLFFIHIQHLFLLYYILLLSPYQGDVRKNNLKFPIVTLSVCNNFVMAVFHQLRVDSVLTQNFYILSLNGKDCTPLFARNILNALIYLILLPTFCYCLIPNDD